MDVNIFTRQNGLSWSEALNRLIEICKCYEMMWSGVRFNILGEPASNNSKELNCAVVNFQPHFTVGEETCDLVIANPHIIQGNIDIKTWINILEKWANNESAQLLDWELNPLQDIKRLDWTTNIKEQNLWNPLINELPRFNSQYIFHRMSGSGDERWTRLYEQILNMSNELGLRYDEWQLQYLGLLMSPTIRSYFIVQMPIGVGVEARFDSNSENIVVSISYRKPLDQKKFIIRSGNTWSLQLPVYTLEEVLENNEGWSMAISEIKKCDDENVNIWISYDGNNIDWSVSVRTTVILNSSVVRQEFLGAWYGLARKTLASTIFQAQNADLFELGFLNMFSVLGYYVVFSGKFSQNTGIDLVAFDNNSDNVYLVSLTISNNIGGKLRTLLSAAQKLLPSLTSLNVCQVIISGSSREEFTPSDISDSEAKHVLVLGKEDYALIDGSGTSMELFRSLLESYFG